MLRLFLALAIALLPACIIIGICYKNVRAETGTSPLAAIFKTMLLGLLTLALVILLNIFLIKKIPLFTKIPEGLVSQAFSSFVLVGFVEEFCKLLAISLFFRGQSALYRLRHYLIYASCISISFAIGENFLYGYLDFKLLLLRSITTVPLHAGTAVILGYFLGRSSHAEHGKLALLVQALFWALLLHGSYDFLLALGNIFSLGSLLILIIILIIITSLWHKALNFDINEADVFEKFRGQP